MINIYFHEVKKILNLLDKNSLKELKLLFFLLFIGGFIESLSIGILIPFITFILEGKESIEIFGIDQNILNTENIYLFAIFAIIVFLFKSIYLTKLEFKSHKILKFISMNLTSRLFEIYIKLKYKNIISKNSSIILRNLNSEIARFTGGVLEPLIMISKNGFLIIFLVIFLLQVNYKISILLLLFAFFFILITKTLLKKILYNFGLINQKYSGEQNKIVTETFQGLKFIKSYGLENIFINNLKKIIMNISTAGYKSSAYRSLPRIWIEFTAIFSIIISGFVIFNISGDLKSFLITSSIILLALLKILPAIVAIINVINNYQNNKSSINLLKKEFDLINNKTNFNYLEKIENLKDIEFNKKIKFQNIHFKFDNDDKELLRGIDLEINRRGDVIGIFGESGSGKTTLIDVLIGLHHPQKIDCNIDGDKISHNINNFLKMNLFGYVPQNTFIFDDTIQNNILLANNSEKNLKRFNEVVREVELDDLIFKLENRDKTIIGENGQFISGGQKQRIGIARALINNPKILIFDEATNSLDAKLEENIFNLVKKMSKKISIIIVSHNPNIKKYCTKTFRLVGGNLKNIDE